MTRVQYQLSPEHTFPSNMVGELANLGNPSAAAVSGQAKHSDITNLDGPITLHSYCHYDLTAFH